VLGVFVFVLVVPLVEPDELVPLVLVEVVVEVCAQTGAAIVAAAKSVVR